MRRASSITGLAALGGLAVFGAFATLLPAPAARAGTYTWSGGLGGGAARSDSWSTGGPQLSLPGWDWNADLGFGGVPFRPGLLQFLATGQYRSLWSGYPDGNSSSHGLGYAISASLFSDLALPISFSASRTRSTFDSEGELTRTGSTLTSTESGTLVLRKLGYPTLRLQLTRIDLDNQAFGAPATTAGTTALSVGASHATPRQEFSLGYDTAWSDGSYAETNYRSHAVQAQASTSVSDSLRFRLSERYFLRLPTIEASTNPRYDDNAFGAGLQWRPGAQVTSGLDYSYRHLLISNTGTPDLEQLGHALRENTAWRWSEDVSVSGTAAAQATTERQGGTSRTGESGTVGGGVSWRRRLRPGLEVTAGGGGTIGAAKPVGEGVQLAYGGTLSGGVSSTWARARGSASYNGAFQNSTTGLAGWSLVQQVNLSGDAAFDNALLSGTLTYSGSHREDPLLGSFLARSLALSLGVRWSRYNLMASAGQSEGVSGSIDQPGISDGLFLPANFNTRSRYATLTTSLRVPGTKIVLSALARTLSTEAPDRPIRHEYGASFSAGYSIGAMTFSLEERFSSGGSGGTWQTGNLIMVRAMRTFGVKL